MKRFPARTTLPAVALLSLILCAPGCTVAPDGNTNAAAPAANANTNANADTNANANLSSTGGSAAAELIAKEKQLWDALKNRDHDAFGKMLAEDSVYVSSDVIGGKAATIEGVKNFAPTEVELSDWKTLVLDEDAAVVTYTVNARGTSGGQPLPPGALRTSTAWVKRGAEWVAVYHQDCPVEERPANQPAAETSKPASGAANANTATPPPAVNSGAADDPIAREKHLWDALKRKDWDTFAAGLAEDQLEVQPAGVSDKAGTLAAVKSYDFTKMTLSDFKATKFDADASLVTYMIKGQAPDGKPVQERAGSIWVNRGGKWLAIFHHSTPVTPTPSR
ncbi:MAG TPA: nuclear transport factor 2 family protein [Pyrinomonadaceae bacterium]|nr:nuclear transport factor 2 family protein [Pyrinomonadaceae bacterium]